MVFPLPKLADVGRHLLNGQLTGAGGVVAGRMGRMDKVRVVVERRLAASVTDYQKKKFIIPPSFYPSCRKKRRRKIKWGSKSEIFGFTGQYLLSLAN